MNPLLFLLAALAGGLGAVLRFALDGAIRSRTRGAFPWGTMVVNLSGSLLIGALLGASITLGLPAAAALLIGTGLLGGYTTFSTANVETLRLLQQRRIGFALVNSVGMLMVCVAGSTAGVAGASTLTGLLVKLRLPERG